MTSNYFTINRDAGTAADGVDTTRVNVSGEIDLSARDELTSTLADIMEIGGNAQIIVDLDHVSFIDCTAIGVIVSGHHAAEQAGIRLRLANAHDVVQRIFDILDLIYLFHPGG